MRKNMDAKKISVKTKIGMKDQTLLDILLSEGFFVDNPCNGKGICGKCKVKILSGDVSPMTTTEEKLLRAEEKEAGIRMSCLVKPYTDLVVALPEQEKNARVLTTGYVPVFQKNPDVRKQKIEIQPPSLDNQISFETQLCLQLGEIFDEEIKIELSVLSKRKIFPGIYTAVLYQNQLMELEEGDTTDCLWGVAIDIGTTTVVCSLVNMITGEEIESSSEINAQKHFGLDVLTRITYEMEHPVEGIEKLQKAIVDSINRMMEEVCKKADISPKSIYEITVGANCTMMHMLLGVDATSIGSSPYVPMFTRARHVLAAQIGLQAAKGARLYCLPSVSAYIGADIVAGTYVCGLKKEKGNVLFIDIGTNGEIVLASHGRLLCCSCAAGPALEGMNICSGMRAADGAIENVEITEEGLCLQVIGEKEPEGICGSGILSVVKELLRTGIVKKSGRFLKKEKLQQEDYRYAMLRQKKGKTEFILSSQSDGNLGSQSKEILVTQGDIRQVQLAKGAILSGFLALLNEAGIGMEDLDKVMIAGQFGAHLPAESLTGTGILPKEVEKRLTYVGNSSKTGAYMALMSGQVKKEIEQLAEKMDYVELSATKDYERLFVKCMTFPG